MCFSLLSFSSCKTLQSFSRKGSKGWKNLIESAIPAIVRCSFEEFEEHLIILGVLKLLFSNQPLSLSDGGRTGYFHCLSRSRVDRLPRPSLENRVSSYPRYEHVTPSLYPRFKKCNPFVVPKVSTCNPFFVPKVQTRNPSIVPKVHKCEVTPS